jgi:hypothetical protein
MEENPSPSNETPPSSRVALRELLVEMKQRDKLFEDYIEVRSRIHNRWIILVGIVAVIAGLWMAQLIHSMMDDMALMSTKMVAMEEYMRSMRQDMGAMKVSMGNMEGAMVPMRGYMETMSEDMSSMRGDIASVPAMQKDVGHMSQSVSRMQYDTGVMRHGVAVMSNDMGSMGHPFRLLNSVTPW